MPSVEFVTIFLYNLITIQFVCPPPLDNELESSIDMIWAANTKHSKWFWQPDQEGTELHKTFWLFWSKEGEIEMKTYVHLGWVFLYANIGIWENNM